jgi:hypothetical protein
MYCSQKSQSSKNNDSDHLIKLLQTGTLNDFIPVPTHYTLTATARPSYWSSPAILIGSYYKTRINLTIATYTTG